MLELWRKQLDCQDQTVKWNSCPADGRHSADLQHGFNSFLLIEPGIHFGDSCTAMAENDAGSFQSEFLPEIRSRVVPKLVRMAAGDLILSVF